MPDWRLHDLRRTMRTGMSGLPTVSPLVAELILAHQQPRIVAVYGKFKYEAEKRAALVAWQARPLSIVEPQPADANVVRSLFLG
jgi:integrase